MRCDKNMKTVGIIGGFGPETTAAFQLEIVDLCAAQKQLTRPPILMWNTPIPIHIEDDLVLRGESVDKFLPFLIAAAKKLERAGADFLVLPCNTLHIFIDEIRSAVSLPVFSIIDETAIFLQKNMINKVGLIGTNITIQSKIHAKKMHQLGITTVTPSIHNQKIIDRAIHNILNHQNSTGTKRDLENIALDFIQRNVHHVVLACTDLQLLFPDIPGLTVHDTMDVLARATVREIIGNNDGSVIK